MKKVVALILILFLCFALPAIAQPNRAKQLQASYNQLVAQAKAQGEALEGLETRTGQVLGMYQERVLADKEIDALRKEIAALKKVKEETPGEKPKNE